MHANRIIVVALLLGGCNELKEVGGGTDGEDIPTAVQLAFDESCAIAGCHGMGAMSGALSLEAPQSSDIIGGNSLAGIPMVTVGDICQSYMAIKLLPDDKNMCATPRSGLQMPVTGIDEPENQENVALILGWIAGAELPGGGGSTGGGPVMCGLDDVATGIPSPIEAGDVADMIPTDIAAVMLDNCGCHFVDDPMAYEGPESLHYTDSFRMRSMADLQAPFDGSAVSQCTGTNWECIEKRVVNQMPLQMPPVACVAMPSTDLNLLTAWLAADAPDGATWVPPG